MLLRYYTLIALLPSGIFAGFCEKTEWRPIKGVLTKKQFKICCPGYKQKITNDRVGFKCEPKCKENCGNGTCISPNSCSCNIGYTNKDKDPAKRCVPVCDGGCGKGECVAPNTCHCEDGYEATKTDHHCAPICSSGCPNGYCESPGNCSCNEGYAQADNQTDAACLPVCATECGEHRKCVAPNTCECLEEYIGKVDACSEHVDGLQVVMDFLKHWMIELAICVASVITLLIVVCICVSRKNRRTKNLVNRSESAIIFNRNNSYYAPSAQLIIEEINQSFEENQKA
ncbi:epidermal growth factor-like protein [Drosophila sulfurigaster albostrigata]|uniref:epidermal growth factor-like protein n=1 Tax=Drosophila sulfurigaster albostrigata TaxID=89887 RepID=UPI002D21BBBE|nr:epidermal growth factor-like protein [Drosophila sulfurigaster albostrigata]